MVHNQPHDPATIWQTALGELQLQLPRETFNTWLRGARFLSHEGGRYTIGVENVYAREWLDQRLRKAITRTLGQVARQPVEVEFVLFKPPHPAAEPAGAGPLLPRQEEPRPTPFYEPLPYA